ncbi:MAG: hypothetical protein DRP56_03975 [Planctomycetota bacterium]|nr:MAG: hypothetical protein DRP56_03975 [Planctomycetota bacterium]
MPSKYDKIITAQKVDGEVRDKERLLSGILEALDNHRDGRLDVSIFRAKKDKTNKQLGNIFGNMIKKVVDYCNDNDHIVDTSDFLNLLLNHPDIPSGNQVTVDFVKLCLYVACPIFNDKGNQITLSKSNTEQANKFFEESANILSTRLTYIPEPDISWRESQ